MDLADPMVLQQHHKAHRGAGDQRIHRELGHRGVHGQGLEVRAVRLGEIGHELEHIGHGFCGRQMDVCHQRIHIVGDNARVCANERVERLGDLDHLIDKEIAQIFGVLADALSTRVAELVELLEPGHGCVHHGPVLFRNVATQRLFDDLVLLVEQPGIGGKLMRKSNVLGELLHRLEQILDLPCALHHVLVDHAKVVRKQLLCALLELPVGLGAVFHQRRIGRLRRRRGRGTSCASGVAVVLLLLVDEEQPTVALCKVVIERNKLGGDKNDERKQKVLLVVIVLARCRSTAGGAAGGAGSRSRRCGATAGL
eukprot:comp22146_c0_seq1/m.51848 comp22146_c0_seq1/g.51848  ORF comp22146_c0_seq1/g.51848 comp22146_c0_seq1/m.51848 type:complete len:311 (+) comp22146_c0_seq1:773-1705(+)